MEAARAGGLSDLQMLRRHVLPNLAGTVVVYATLMVPQMIVYESFLSFLGLGVEPPRASLGSLINAGARQMLSAPWLLLVPAVVLIVLLLAFNVLGDALRDVLDPHQR
jgi:oligopeptide transport system permease protein